MRPIAHVIDTKARKLVPNVFPDTWEYRELSGRDYGIDMELDIFHNENPTGQLLLLQIKGYTGQTKINSDGCISFPVPVNTLIYSERMITPFILVICPINDDDRKCYYLWLQEYIKCILDIDSPDWRAQKTKNVYIPQNNILPKDENIRHLNYISHFPQRLFGACEVARISNNLMYKLDGEPRPIDFKDAMFELEKILRIPGFINAEWSKGGFVEETYLRPAIKACEIISQDRKPLEEEIEYFKRHQQWIDHIPPYEFDESEYIDFQLKAIVKHSMQCLSFYYEETNYVYSNFMWHEEKSHKF
jgi:hypothetical protein